MKDESSYSWKLHLTLQKLFNYAKEELVISNSDTCKVNPVTHAREFSFGEAKHSHTQQKPWTFLKQQQQQHFDEECEIVLSHHMKEHGIVSNIGIHKQSRPTEINRLKLVSGTTLRIRCNLN